MLIKLISNHVFWLEIPILQRNIVWYIKHIYNTEEKEHGLKDEIYLEYCWKEKKNGQTDETYL